MTSRIRRIIAYRNLHAAKGHFVTQANAVNVPDKAMRLNPDWVELLMGWPLGWTDITKPCTSTTPDGWSSTWEDGVPRVVLPSALRVDRLRRIGNGQVPQVVVMAVTMLSRRCHTPNPATA